MYPLTLLITDSCTQIDRENPTQTIAKADDATIAQWLPPSAAELAAQEVVEAAAAAAAATPKGAKSKGKAAPALEVVAEPVAAVVELQPGDPRYRLPRQVRTLLAVLSTADAFACSNSWRVDIVSAAISACSEQTICECRFRCSSSKLRTGASGRSTLKHLTPK